MNGHYRRNQLLNQESNRLTCCEYFGEKQNAESEFTCLSESTEAAILSTVSALRSSTMVSRSDL